MRVRCDVSPFPGAADTRLDAGQTMRLPVAAGTVLVARAGRLRVTEPRRWLGERVVVVSRDLDEGQAHVVDGAGWVEVGAVDAAGGWLHRLDSQPAPGPMAIWRWFLALVRNRRPAAAR